MLFGKRGFCILCGKYKNIGKSAHMAYEEICICNDCFDSLETTKDKTFAGKGYIKLVISPYLYSGGLREAIKDFKFSGQRLYGELLGQLLAEGIGEFGSFLSEFDCVVPVPLHRTRQLQRGYNQSEIIARRTAESLGIPMVNDVLVRKRNTERQSRLRGAERIENVRDAFGAFENFVKDKRIILVDDIYTMGETARACAEALKNAKAAEIVVTALCIGGYSKN